MGHAASKLEHLIFLSYVLLKKGACEKGYLDKVMLKRFGLSRTTTHRLLQEIGATNIEYGVYVWEPTDDQYQYAQKVIEAKERFHETP